MPQSRDSTFLVDFRRSFLRGLATLLPTVLTIFVLVKCFEFVQENISVHITEGVIRLQVFVSDSDPKVTKKDTEEYILLHGGVANSLDVQRMVRGEKLRAQWQLSREEVESYVASRGLTARSVDDPKMLRQIQLHKLRTKWNRTPLSLIGFGLAIILVYIVGRLLASFLGHKLWKMFERAVGQVPLFKQVYPYVKQVTEFLFGENKIEFSRVVAVQYPRKGIWSLGLVTGAGFQGISALSDDALLTVFIPSSPTPVTGYVIHTKKSDVVDLPISIEEALRFTISGGVIVPEHQMMPGQQIELSPGPAISPEAAENQDKH